MAGGAQDMALGEGHTAPRTIGAEARGLQPIRGLAGRGRRPTLHFAGGSNATPRALAARSGFLDRGPPNGGGWELHGAVGDETIPMPLQAFQRQVEMMEQPPPHHGICAGIRCARQAGEPRSVVIDEKGVALNRGV
jgi:hypothetical protein